MAASKTIGGINVTISATIDKFQKAMGLARRTLTGFTSAVSKAVFSMKGFAAALTGGLTLAAFTKMTASAFDQIDALGELSDKLGISTQALAGYQLAASEVGISNETLERSLTRLTGKGMTLRGWIRETSQLSTQQEKLAAATKMFGVRGSSMVRFLNVGAEGLTEARKAAESLGLALDRKTVAGVDRAKDAFARFKMAVSGIFRSLAAEIAPFIEVLSNKMTGFLASNGRGKGIGSSIANAIINMAKFVADGIQKMVGAVLNAMADFRQMIFDFRAGDSWLANASGLKFKNAAETTAGFKKLAASTMRADAWNKQSPWSETIEGWMEAARRKAAEAAKESTVGMAGGPLSRLFGNLTGKGREKFGAGLTGAGRTGADFWAQMLRGVASVPGLQQRLFLEAQKFQANNWKKNFGGAGGLAFAESGSAESFRQQASIRRQSENIAKKHLKVDERALAALERIDRKTMPVAEAGIG